MRGMSDFAAHRVAGTVVGGQEPPLELDARWRLIETAWVKGANNPTGLARLTLSECSDTFAFQR
jgi:hypothetical protein